MKDLYYILGQDTDATPVELNAAYRKLAQKLRPESEEPDPFIANRFNDIVEAYQVLSDPEKRRKYDITLRKSQKRRLYWFKLSYLSVAAVLTLIGFTALFGFYVIKMINGGKTKPVAVVKVENLALIPPKHHKKKHKAVSAIAAIYPAPNKQIVVEKVPLIKKDTAKARIVKPVVSDLKAIKPPVTISQAIAANPSAPVNTPKPAKTTVTAYLQANTTGVVSLHQLASYQSAILTYIPDHSEVQVLEKGPGFCKVTFHDQTGYVPKWTVPEQ